METINIKISPILKAKFRKICRYETMTSIMTREIVKLVTEFERQYGIIDVTLNPEDEYMFIKDILGLKIKKDRYERITGLQDRNRFE